MVALALLHVWPVATSQVMSVQQVAELQAVLRSEMTASPDTVYAVLLVVHCGLLGSRGSVH